MKPEKIFPAPISDLLDKAVRDRCKLAYWPAVDILAVHAATVRRCPQDVQWLTVREAVAEDGAWVVLVSDQGHRFAEHPASPVVLGEESS